MLYQHHYRSPCKLPTAVLQADMLKYMIRLSSPHSPSRHWGRFSIPILFPLRCGNHPQVSLYGFPEILGDHRRVLFFPSHSQAQGLIQRSNEEKDGVQCTWLYSTGIRPLVTKHKLKQHLCCSNWDQSKDEMENQGAVTSYLTAAEENNPRCSLYHHLDRY